MARSPATRLSSPRAEDGREPVPRRPPSQWAHGAAPTLIHAWTPRENVRELTEELAARYGCPYFVHLEDNEDLITAERLGISYKAILYKIREFGIGRPRSSRKVVPKAAAQNVVAPPLETWTEEVEDDEPAVSG